MKTRNNKLFLYDILECCTNIGTYIDGVSGN